MHDAGILVTTIIAVKITFDPARRDLTLAHRGLDFADAERVFAGDHATWVDDRFDYREIRQITAGWLEGAW
jgi:uncharacterized DUF497 family protein